MQVCVLYVMYTARAGHGQSDRKWLLLISINLYQGKYREIFAKFWSLSTFADPEDNRRCCTCRVTTVLQHCSTTALLCNTWWVALTHHIAQPPHFIFRYRFIYTIMFILTRRVARIVLSNAQCGAVLRNWRERLRLVRSQETRSHSAHVRRGTWGRHVSRHTVRADTVSSHGTCFLVPGAAK